ncbi:Stage III sporulation protein AD [Candidatus Syntrophocurvum alkaliphilum]|uniref:Stage III sporulation protein AD n=1 Tax=Candidatus Syntrophocurvum alkaliphilum TaxID=2293317 RepID=A0A6I6D718_9FIRM|nr:stage III sporulation protein AD [Candidatus Syntrophocurvum alkaliphilum]QGT98953.1 Stage III sporulation protein AD [Candidatus Syntrophocurvum alkaliphilum]
MEIAQIVGMALITTMLLMILRQQKPVMAIMLSLVFGVMIFMFLMDKMAAIVNVMQELARRAEMNYFFLTTILKILGVAYLGEFAAAICQDAGEHAVAKKVEFAAKIIIAVLALPIMIAILDSLMELMPR